MENPKPIDNQVTIERIPDKPKKEKPRMTIVKQPVVMSFN
jgi:hypothetical protein